MPYIPDPKCIAVKVFLLDWSKLDFYAFSAIVCLNRSLQKIYQDKAKGIAIAPDWPFQPFYPRLIAMSTKTISIAPRETNFYLPNQPAVKHPMEKTLKILACSVDGTKVIRKSRKPNLRLLDSWASDTRKKNSTKYTSDNGPHFAKLPQQISHMHRLKMAPNFC